MVDPMGGLKNAYNWFWPRPISGNIEAKWVLLPRIWAKLVTLVSQLPIITESPKWYTIKGHVLGYDWPKFGYFWFDWHFGFISETVRVLQIIAVKNMNNFLWFGVNHDSSWILDSSWIMIRHESWSVMNHNPSLIMIRHESWSIMNHDPSWIMVHHE